MYRKFRQVMYHYVIPLMEILVRVDFFEKKITSPGQNSIVFDRIYCSVRRAIRYRNAP